MRVHWDRVPRRSWPVPSPRTVRRPVCGFFERCETCGTIERAKPPPGYAGGGRLAGARARSLGGWRLRPVRASRPRMTHPRCLSCTKRAQSTSAPGTPAWQDCALADQRAQAFWRAHSSIRVGFVDGTTARGGHCHLQDWMTFSLASGAGNFGAREQWAGRVCSAICQVHTNILVSVETVPILSAFRLRGDPREWAIRAPHGLCGDWHSLLQWPCQVEGDVLIAKT